MLEQRIRKVFDQTLQELGNDSGWSVESNVVIVNPQYRLEADIVIRFHIRYRHAKGLARTFKLEFVHPHTDDIQFVSE